MGKVLSIDFGLKRTGLALSDASRTFAFGLKTIDSRQLMQELNTLIPKENITVIVLGEPKRLDTSDSHITENVRLLYQTLTAAFPLTEIVLLDERFTSKMAAAVVAQSGLKKKDRQQKGLIDAISATILLQDYLQAHGN